jgi:hypothetical protein
MRDNGQEVLCPECRTPMLQALGIPRPPEEMGRYFGISESCTQWECPRCFQKLFVGVDTQTTYPWRDPVGWGE